MGITVRVDAPAFSSDAFTVPASVPAAWIQPELPFKTAPRYLLTLFVVDRDLLLKAVLTSIDSELLLPATGRIAELPSSDRRVRFSIDGSLASSLRGAFMTAIVLRALVPSELSRAAGSDLDDYVRDLLRARVAEELELLHLPENSIGNIEIDVFESLSEKLFRGRRFAEYRFGVATASSDSRARLATMLQQFTNALGESGVPIAYLYFPDHEHSGSEYEDFEWARVGVGAPTRAVESMEVDLIANKFARDSGCVYRKYDPVLGGESMDDRFALIANYESSREALAKTAQTSSPTDVDVVFVHSPARVGLVGEMLAGQAGPGLLAGSMTVLAGQTISCWVFPLGSGSNLISGLRDLGLSDPANTRSQLHALGPVRGEVDLSTTNMESYWVAWRCNDAPGVVRRLVDALIKHVSDQRGATPDFRYMITRVLANGAACAGKLKLRVPSVVDGAELDLAVIHGLVTSELQAIGQDRVEVRVQRGEPGEEPWASLLVL